MVDEFIMGIVTVSFVPYIDLGWSYMQLQTKNIICFYHVNNQPLTESIKSSSMTPIACMHVAAGSRSRTNGSNTLKPPHDAWSSIGRPPGFLNFQRFS